MQNYRRREGWLPSISPTGLAVDRSRLKKARIFHVVAGETGLSALDPGGIEVLESDLAMFSKVLTAARSSHSPVENEHVRVIRTRYLARQIVPCTRIVPACFYSYRVGAISSVAILRATCCSIRGRTSEAPNLNIPIWLEPLPPHSVENVGGAENQ